jgi:hypothetical protein
MGSVLWRADIGGIMNLVKRTCYLAAGLLLLVGCTSGASAGILGQFDFETAWSTDYAPGWDNSLYRHGEAPVGKMMEQVGGGVGGGSAMKLIADSTPQAWMWWAAVNPVEQYSSLMTKALNPWVSVDYFDEGWESGTLHQAGQLYAVPSWVNPYIPPGEDWTDVQFGARMNTADNYYYVAAGQNGPGWQSTGVARGAGWVNLKMQLSATDGRIHFYVNGVDKGTSYRNDYADLTGVGLYTMFTDPLSGWGDNKPYAIYDNFKFGSDVPEPSTMVLLLGVGLVGFGIRRLRRR